MKFNNNLKTCVKRNLEKCDNIPMLIGEPGIGKSSWVKALAEEMRTKVFVLQCNLLADKADLTGTRFVPDEKSPKGFKQVVFPHEIIMDAINYAEEHPREMPILFLDEINRTTVDVTSACLSLATDRKIVDIALPKNLRLIVAGNDKGNVNILDDASITRFIAWHVEPDVSTFISINKELNPFIKNVLTAHPDCIYGHYLVSTGDDEDDEAEMYDIIDESDNMEQSTTPRTITSLSNFLNDMDNKTIISFMGETVNRKGEDISLLQEVIEAHVGRTSFTAYLLEEIAKGIQTVNTQANAVTVTKPKSYDDMKNCADRSALDDFFSTLDEKEKSGIMLYCLYENTDNTIYIETLAPHLDKLISADLTTLMNLSMAGKLDSENAQVLLETKSMLSTNLETILSILT